MNRRGVTYSLTHHDSYFMLQAQQQLHRMIDTFTNVLQGLPLNKGRRCLPIHKMSY